MPRKKKPTAKKRKPAAKLKDLAKKIDVGNAEAADVKGGYTTSGVATTNQGNFAMAPVTAASHKAPAPKPATPSKVAKPASPTVTPRGPVEDFFN